MSTAPAQTGSTPVSVSDPLLTAEGPLLYDREYPVMQYAQTRPNDRVARLFQERLAAGTPLQPGADRAALERLLTALDINLDTQVLVYSRTSLNFGLVHARNPRAIYFNDDTYVAWVPGSDALEITAMDPVLGPVFYTLNRVSGERGALERLGGQCLRCHDSYTLTGGGVPRFLIGSGYTYGTGYLVSHEGWIVTTPETPIKFRWGGWYVTGTHGDMVHLGNMLVQDPAELMELEEHRKGNIPRLDGYLPEGVYPTVHSDIVALLVLEHQIHIQNLITRVQYDMRQTMADPAWGTLTPEKSTEVIAGISEPLVEALLMRGEVPLTDTVTGSTDFARTFTARGPFDGQQRTLRELDLKTRLFRYPLSYLIYSAELNALPEPALDYIRARLHDILTTPTPEPGYDYLTDADRRDIREILADTRPDWLTGKD